MLYQPIEEPHSRRSAPWTRCIPVMPIAPMGRSHGAALLLLRRRQAQVLEVETEVGPRRDRHHQRLDDLAVRTKRESQEQIGRESCRARVCQYVSISVVAGTLTNNKQ